MAIADNIALLRGRANFTQGELALRLGTEEQTVVLWETGRAAPTATHILALCGLFGVSADELLGREKAPGGAAAAGPEPIASGATVYEPGVAFKYTRKGLRRSGAGLLILGAVFLILSALPLGGDSEFLPAFFTILGLSAPLFWIITRGMHRSSALAQAKLFPNLRWNFAFFAEYLHVESSSDRSVSSMDFPYALISEFRQDERYVVFYYGNSYLYADKTALSGDAAQAIALLQSGVKKYKAAHPAVRIEHVNATPAPTKAWKTVLMVLFVLSILTLWLAPIIGVFFTDTTFGISWGYAIALAIPLASLGLGIVAQRKGIPAKKNIIAGAVVGILLIAIGTVYYLGQSVRYPAYYYIYPWTDELFGLVIGLR